jgi:hypothetical protein
MRFKHALPATKAEEALNGKTIDDAYAEAAGAAAVTGALPWLTTSTRFRLPKPW